MIKPEPEKNNTIDLIFMLLGLIDVTIFIILYTLKGPWLIYLIVSSIVIGVPLLVLIIIGAVLDRKSKKKSKGDD